MPTQLRAGHDAELKADLDLEIGTDVQAYSADLDAVSGTNTGDEPAASATVAGVVELATIAEVDAGTDTVRAITPAGLAGSALQTKVDGIEASADVTDTDNVTAAGALMDSEVTNLAQVKAFDSSDYATAAQGALADSALQSIADESVTLAKMAHMATDSFLGRDTAGTGDVEVLSATTARSVLNVEDGADVTDETNVKAALDGATLTDVGTPASTDRILLQDASDSNNLKYADFSEFGGGGGGTPSDMACATFYDNTGGQVLTSSSRAVVNLDTTMTNDGGVFSLATDEVTVSEAGNYLVHFAIGGDLNTGTRDNYYAYLQKDTGSGFSDVDGTKIAGYNRSSRRRYVIFDIGHAGVGR